MIGIHLSVEGTGPALCHELDRRVKRLSRESGANPIDPSRGAGTISLRSRLLGYVLFCRTRQVKTPQGVPGAGGTIPAEPSISALREAAAGCTNCHLYRNATQTVFGEGPERARVMLVGEQPGDAEDLAGHPFVGPAGKLLDRCLAEAGIDRALTYVTNVVKHFKWVPRGPRRIHSKPGAVEIEACFPWLEAEIRVVAPAVVVALGATAAQALFGKAFRVSRDRGRLIPFALAPHALATMHPSALLRAPDEETRRHEILRFVEDLRQAAAILKQPPT